MTARQRTERRERQIVMKGRDSHRCTVFDITKHEDRRLWGWIRGGNSSGYVQVMHLRGRYWREITKSCRRMMAQLFASGECHRIETVALASRTKAGRWYMKALGERFEGVARAWFPDGRDAAIYAKVKE